MSTSSPCSTPQERRELAQTLGNFAVEMRTLTDSAAVLEAIVTAAIDVIPDARWAGIAVVSRRKVQPGVQTDQVAGRLAQLQTDTGEGPAMSVLDERRTLYVEDLGSDDRWPEFGPAAVGLGVHSLVAFRLFVTDESLGVLTLYAEKPHAFPSEAITTGEVLAQHAAVAMAGSIAEEQLQNAVASRDLIGQAKGILMHRDRLTGLQAFAALTKASQETNIRLSDVAKLFVADHEAAVATQADGV